MSESRALSIFVLVLLAAGGGALYYFWQIYFGDPATIFGPDQKFSADIVITIPSGEKLEHKVYRDGGKIRAEINWYGKSIVYLFRPDLQNIYAVQDDRKRVLVAAYDPTTYEKITCAVDPKGSFELIGSEKAEGVACTKYKVTNENKSKKNLFVWIDSANKIPFMMTTEDYSLTLHWMNYKAGAQDASLFEPPAGYETVALPVGQSLPMPGQ